MKSCKGPSCSCRGCLRSLRHPRHGIAAGLPLRWRLCLLATLGLGALGSLLAALLDDPPHLMAAGLAAALGWLACYAYMLQRECGRLARASDEEQSKQLAASEEPTGRGRESEMPSGVLDGMDLDLTSVARSLGNPFGHSIGSIATPSRGKSGRTMQAVLTSALVNEYLRCATLLQKYQKRHGFLPNAPHCSPGFAEALLTSLQTPADDRTAPSATAGGTQVANTPIDGSQASGTLAGGDEAVPAGANEAASNAAAPQASEGTPNFESRMAAMSAELESIGTPGGHRLLFSPEPVAPAERSLAGSPPPVRNSPFAESQRAREDGAAKSGLAELLQQGSSSPSVPPAPAAELERCHTMDNAGGGAVSFAPSTEASPEIQRGPAGRVQSRNLQDVDSSVNDPPWLREATRHRLCVGESR